MLNSQPAAEQPVLHPDTKLYIVEALAFNGTIIKEAYSLMFASRNHAEAVGNASLYVRGEWPVKDGNSVQIRNVVELPSTFTVGDYTFQWTCLSGPDGTHSDPA